MIRIVPVSYHCGAYSAPSSVVRVFDTDANGNLHSVPFTQDPATPGEFQLIYAPHGQVLAEVGTDPEDSADRVRTAVATLQAACHGAAQHWWTNPKTGEDTRSNPMCFDQKLMLIVSEVAEAMEGNRKSLPDDKLPHREMREVELADALIRICDTAGGFKMDLAGAVVEKMAFNAVRPDHKTENRLAAGGKAY